MRDLELAKEILKGKELSLVIVKQGEPLYESSLSGMGGLLRGIEKLRNRLYDSSVADKVVGRAAALLLIHSRVKEVYAATLSNEGLKVLSEHNVPVEHEGLVPKILDKEGKNICPFEQFSLTISSIDEAYEELKAFTENLRRKQ